MDFQIFTAEQLFVNHYSKNEFKGNILLEIDRYKVFLDDQPGAIRFNLDNIIDTSFAKLFEIQSISIFLQDYFKTNNIYVRYIRFRNPILDEGEQEFHVDWDEKSKIKRLEFFFMLDEMNLKNGCIEIIKDNVIKSILTPECSVLLIDSTILHRGTKNISGEQRRIISCQLAAELMSHEPYLKVIDLK
jgi:hypothetical protein